MITRVHLESIQTKIDELNKRATKLGMEPLSLSVREVGFVQLHKGNFSASDSLFDVQIFGNVPIVNGWKIVAKVEFSDVVVVKALVDVDPKYRSIDPICEHCGTHRRRNAVYVLRDETGAEKVVGHNCLADFVRSDKVEKLFELWFDCDKILRDPFSGGFGPAPIPTILYLSAVAMMIRKFGWVSKKMADEGLEPTSSLVWKYFNRLGEKTQKWIETNDLYISNNDTELAHRVITWAVSKLGDRSEYLHTLSTLCSKSLINWKYDSYLASAVAAYQREHEPKPPGNKPVEFLGEVGTRLRDVDAIIRGTWVIDGNYGVTTIIRLEAERDGIRYPITWFASGDHDYLEGDSVKLTGTVKKHETHPTYGKSTVLTRCKITVCEKV